jgi:probable HAF family extracellular repeat protein
MSIMILPKVKHGCLLVCAVALAESAVHAQVTIHAINPPTGASYLSAADLSDDGTTIVGWFQHALGRKAFKWTLANGVQELWTGSATAVNADGSVVIGVIEGLSFGSAPYVSSIGYATGMSSSSLPVGVSGDGTRVVGVGPHYVCGTTLSRAFWWSQSPLEQAWLPTLHANWCTGVAEATAISSDGAAFIGTSSSDSGYSRAFRFFSSTLQGLGSLDGTSSFATDTNHNGSCVVGWSSSGEHTHGFLWELNSGMQDLGTAPGASDSAANGVAAEAMVIVGVSGRRASIWKPGMGMVSLELFLSAQGLDLEGWELLAASGVSADGTVIFGTGLLNGADAHWVVRGVLPCDPIGDHDVNENGIADSCEADCNRNSLPDSYEISTGLVTDCDEDLIPDMCEIAAGKVDCNSNQLLDACEIASGTVSDFDQNGIPDSCECLADLFVDGVVNGADLGIALSQWGQGKGAVADINRDGLVNGADLSILLSSWGACP